MHCTTRWQACRQRTPAGDARGKLFIYHATRQSEETSQNGSDVAHPASSILLHASKDKNFVQGKGQGWA